MSSAEKHKIDGRKDQEMGKGSYETEKQKGLRVLLKELPLIICLIGV